MEMSFNITKNNQKFASKGFVEVLVFCYVKHRHTLRLKSFSKPLGTMNRSITLFAVMPLHRRYELSPSYEV